MKRMSAMHVPIPFSPPLEDATVPTERTVCERRWRFVDDLIVRSG